MNEGNQQLDRLLKAAARAPQSVIAPASFALEARVMAGWRSARSTEDAVMLISWFRRAVVCACLVMLLSLVWSYNSSPAHTGIEPMTQPSKGKLILYVVSLFLVGAITGSALTYSLMGKRHQHGERPSVGIVEHMRSELKSKLGLTDEQVKKFDPMIDKAGTELHGIQTNTMQRVSQVIDNLHAQMRPELTPEQKTKLEEMEKEFRERRNRYRRSDSPPASSSKTNSVSK
jgi:hypothetical protein